MDHKYIQDLYNQLGGEKVFGKYEDYYRLITTDEQYIKDVYNSKGESTFGSYNDFVSLVKKKDELQPTSQKVVTESITEEEEIPTLSASLYEDDQDSEIAKKLEANTRRVGSSLSRIPLFLAEQVFTLLAPDDVKEKVNNLPAEQREGLLSSFISSSTPSVAGGGFIANITPELTQYYQEQTEKIKEIEDTYKKYDTSIGEDFSNLDIVQALDRSFVEIIGGAPQLVQAMVPGVGIASIVLGSAAEKSGELQREGEDLGLRTSLNSVVTGAAEGIFEVVTKKLGEKILDSFKINPEETIKTLGTHLKELFIDANLEGGSEFATSIVQNLSDKLIQGRDVDFYDALREAIDSYIIGAGTGSTLTGTGKSVSTIKNIAQKSKLSRKIKDSKYDNLEDVFIPVTNNDGSLSDKTDIDQVTLDIASSPVSRKFVVDGLNKSVNSGKLTREEADKRLVDFDNIREANSKISDDIKGESRLKAVDLIREKKSIQKDIEGIDPALTKNKESRIQEINNELEQIANAIQEQTAGQVPVQPETTVSETVEEGTPQAESEVVTETQEEVDQSVIDEEKIANILIPESSIKQKVYHGSEGKVIGEFKKMNPNIDGIFFSSDIENAKTYGKDILEAYVDLKNPLVIDANGLKFTDDIPVTVIASYPDQKPYETTINLGIDEIVYMVKNGKRKNSFIEIPNRNQYDGLVFKNIIDPSLSSKRDVPQDTVVVFENSQIKRADESNTEFTNAVESLLNKTAPQTIIENAEALAYKPEEVVETTDAAAFAASQAEAITQRKDDKLQVTPLTKGDAQNIIDEGGKLFITKDGKSGAYVTADGYMGGLFKQPEANRTQAAKVLQDARIQAGGKFFDAFGINTESGKGTTLEDIYIKNGFRPVARMTFNPEFAPDGWENTNLKNRPDNVFFVYDPTYKATKGEGQRIEDYDQAYELAKNFSPEAAEIESEVQTLRELFKEPEQRKQVENAEKALKAIAPDVKIVVHESEEAYAKATNEQNRAQKTAGEYNPKTKTIHINPVKANARTVAHEAFHAILLSTVKTDAEAQRLTDAMMKAVAKVASPELKEYLDAFASNYDQNIRSEEKLAELVGKLASEYGSLPKPTQNVIKRWLDRLAKMFGLKPFTDNDVIDLLNTISGKVAEGNIITNQDLKILNKVANNPTDWGISLDRKQKRTKPAPKKTIKAYKLFRVSEKFPGKIFPLFVDANTPVEDGVWIDADMAEGYSFQAENGHHYIPSTQYEVVNQRTGKTEKRKTGQGVKIPNEKVRQELIDKGFLPKGSKAETVVGLARRPGWHSGDLPMSTHLGSKSKGSNIVDTRSDDQVWVEVEMAADVDWQEKANKAARITKAGSIDVKTAHITDQIPEDGYYKYKTNPTMTGSWIIGGSMKVNKILSDEEVKSINDAAGVEDLPRTKPFNAKRYGFSETITNQDVATLNKNKSKKEIIKSRKQIFSKASSAEMFENPDILQPKREANGRTKVIELGRAFDKRAKDNGYYIPIPKNGVYTESQLNQIAEAMTDDAELQLLQDDSGIGWYDLKTRSAMELMSRIHPELSDSNSKPYLEFTLMVALISQNNSVGINFRQANEAYTYYKNNNKLPNKPYAGKSGNIIKQNIALAFEAIKKKGWEKYKNTLQETKTVKEWEAEGYKVNGENKTTKITGAMAMLGSKIGSFWGNLNGDFNTLTADLWFSRMFNRYTGNVVAKKASEKSKQTTLDELKKYEGKTLLNGYKKSDILKGGEVFDKWLNTIVKDYADGGYKDKQRLNIVSNTHFKNTNGELQDIPRGGQERNTMRNVVKRVQDKLIERGYPKLDIADIQAIVWYNEKDLYRQYKAVNKSSEKTDYETAAQEVLREQGVNAEVALPFKTSKSSADGGRNQTDRIQPKSLSEKVDDAPSIRKQATGRPSIDNVIKIAKENNISDAAIRKFLQEDQGMTTKQADDAVKNYNEVQRRKGLKVEGVKDPSAITFFGKEVLSENNLKKMYQGLLFLKSARANQPKSMFIGKEDKAGAVEGAVKRAYNTLNKLDRITKKLSKKDLDNVMAELDSYLRGNKEAKLPDNIKKIAFEMRTHLDYLSKKLVEVGAVPDVSFDELGPKKKKELIEKAGSEADARQDYKSAAENILGNVGEYLNRSFAVHTDKNWKDKVSEKVVEDAKAYLRKSMAKSIEAKAIKENKDFASLLEQEVNAVVDRLLDPNESKSFFNTANASSKNTGILKQKQDIAPEILALMGEQTSPAMNYIISVQKIASLAAQQTFLNNVREKGLGVFLFENEADAPKGFRVKIASEGSKTMNPLNGMYTSPEIAKALNETYKKPEGIIKVVFDFINFLYLKPLGAVKYSKTILSPGTHSKNIIGNGYFMLANGYLNPKDWADAGIVVWNEVKSGDNDALNNKYIEYIEAGVINASATLNDLKRTLSGIGNKVESEEEFERRVQDRLYGKNIIKKGLKGAEKAYQLEDDYFKIISYEVNKRQYAKALFKNSFENISDKQKQEVIEIAKEVTKNTLPNYERIAAIRDALKILPFGSNFLSFHMEALRTSYNTIDLAFKEIKDPRTAAIGARRLAGISAVIMLSTGIIGNLLGGGDDEDEKDDAIRKLLPHWSENSKIRIVSTEGENIVYQDLSASSPYGSMEKAMNAYSRGEDISDSLKGTFDELFGAFYADDIIVSQANKYNEVVSSQGFTSREGKEALARGLYETFKPGGLTSSEKIFIDDRMKLIDAAFGRKIELKKEGKVGEAVGQFSGYGNRIVKKNAVIKRKLYEIGSAGFGDFKSGKARSASTDYNNRYRDFLDGKVSEDEVEKAYDRSNLMYKEAMKEAIEIYKAALILDINYYDMVDVMKETGFSKKEIELIDIGETPELKRKGESDSLSPYQKFLKRKSKR